MPGPVENADTGAAPLLYRCRDCYLFAAGCPGLLLFLSCMLIWYFNKKYHFIYWLSVLASLQFLAARAIAPLTLHRRNWNRVTSVPLRLAAARAMTLNVFRRNWTRVISAPQRLADALATVLNRTPCVLRVLQRLADAPAPTRSLCQHCLE